MASVQLEILGLDGMTSVEVAQLLVAAKRTLVVYVDGVPFVVDTVEAHCGSSRGRIALALQDPHEALGQRAKGKQSLDVAYGGGLDMIGDAQGCPRKQGESDVDYRNRLRTPWLRD